ncbi:hypothetical protein L289_0680 [Acinetobacter gerneri DSM 14967 = CIP 107464 = MTCC 9824]|nr:hypothetical protein L289_0680 [Acinetobacter gerneri DSM 14967 = CIP 107464 = MTCC 9824]
MVPPCPSGYVTLTILPASALPTIGVCSPVVLITGTFGTVLSIVTGPRLALVLLFPAISVCLTKILPASYLPSGMTKVVPAPVFQVLPPSRLYSHLARVSKPETLTVPSEVIPSVLLVPVSFAKAMVGAAANASTVANTSGDLFPAGSVAFTIIWLLSAKPGFGTDHLPLASTVVVTVVPSGNFT